MKFGEAAAPAGAAAVLLGALASASVGAYLEGPPPAHTGGFGEPTCAACHFDHATDDPAGRLTLTGLPDAYEAGGRYRLEIALERPDLRRAGFQLAARFGDGDRLGRQAGTLRATDGRVEVVLDEAHGVEYAQHTTAGAGRGGAVASWSVEWQAPDEPLSAVTFSLAANAANDDESALGDWVYVATEQVAAHAAHLQPAR